MASQTIVLCVSILLLFVIVDHLRYLPRNVVINKYFRSEFRGRGLVHRKMFADYLRKLNKSYGPEEFHKRFRHFKESLKEIEGRNDGTNHATFGVTKFSDWSRKERFRILAPQLGGTCEGRENTCSRNGLGRAGRHRSHGKDGKIPLEWDWREHRAVSPIFDQKQCPICWAASTAGVMESMAAIHGFGLTSLSIQQLMDCTFESGAIKTGCREGRPLVDVFDYLCENYTPLATEEQYPLTFNEEACRNVRGERSLMKFDNNCGMHNDESKLVEVLARGPVTALVDARLFFNYLDGVITHHCIVTEDDLNHAVQIVGYNTTAQPPYYIVRNSWGEDWGENGYVRIAIGSNQCGIAYSIGILDVY